MPDRMSMIFSDRAPYFWSKDSGANREINNSPLTDQDRASISLQIRTAYDMGAQLLVARLRGCEVVKIYRKQFERAR